MIVRLDEKKPQQKLDLDIIIADIIFGQIFGARPSRRPGRRVGENNVFSEGRDPCVIKNKHNI